MRAFERLYRDWPPKLLIADEVGLGKTIQAGLLLRQAWLAGRVERILILAPKAILKQWQIELREKFNLNWPIYDGHKMVRYPSPALRGRHERAVNRDEWHNEGTIETDVYRALRSRIGLFESVVGRLQPILARLPRTISQAVLSGEDRDARERANVVDAIKQQARETEQRGFDIDAVTEEDLAQPERPLSPVTMDDLDRIIGSSDLMPPGTDIQPLAPREYGLLAPGMTEHLRVTTDPEYFEEHAESLELWSPGNPLFNPPEFVTSADEWETGKTLKDLLER